MSRQRLPQGQRQPLARRILGRVGGLLNDVHALEMRPERMGGFVIRPEAKVSAASK